MAIQGSIYNGTRGRAGTTGTVKGGGNAQGALGVGRNLR